jgi:hypothetical protein
MVNAAGFPAMVSMGMLQTVPETTSENTSPSGTALNHPVVAPQQAPAQQQEQLPQQQQQQEDASAASGASPFAALAQRAGSLFGPLPTQ